MSEMVTLRRDEYEALLDRIEDAEDQVAVLQHRLEAFGEVHWLSSDEIDRLLGEDSMETDGP